MSSTDRIFTSQRGYNVGINHQNTHVVDGWLEVYLGMVPIKIPFRGISCHKYDMNFDFSTFIEWNPYFDKLVTAMSGSCFGNQLSIKWAITASDHGNKLTKVLGHGRDKLFISSMYTFGETGINKSFRVPHPFNLDFLSIEPDPQKIDGILALG